MIGLRFRNERGILFPDPEGTYRVIKVSDTGGRHVLVAGRQNSISRKAYIIDGGRLSFTTIYPCKKYCRVGRRFVPDAKKGDPLHVSGQFPNYHIGDVKLYIDADRVLHRDPVDFVEQVQQRHDEVRAREKVKTACLYFFTDVKAVDGEYRWIVYLIERKTGHKRRNILARGSERTYARAENAAQDAKASLKAEQDLKRQEAKIKKLFG